MSLDIAVMVDHETVDRSVPVGAGEHNRLMEICRTADLELLNRFGDYYSKGEIFYQELIALQAELQHAKILGEGDSEVVRIVEDLIDLTNFARETRRSLVALPD